MNSERGDVHTMPNDGKHESDSTCWCFPTAMNPHNKQIVTERPEGMKLVWIHHNIPEE